MLKFKHGKKIAAAAICLGLTVAGGTVTEGLFLNAKYNKTQSTAPKLRPDTVSKYSKSVVVTISEWDNADVKEYKVGRDGQWQTYTEPVLLKKNDVIYARAKSGDEYSSIASLKVNNIGRAPSESSKDIIFVAPEGDDDGAGTIDDPMSFDVALKTISPGGTIYVRGGKYEYNYQITIEKGNDGEEGAMKNIIAYGNEKPVFDFSSQNYDYNNLSLNARGLQINANYWYVKGLEFYGAADNGLFIGGSNNKIELCIANANRDSGIQVSRMVSSLNDISQWPSNNYILNCTSFNNSDPATGENADGVACKLTSGVGNIFEGCITYNNVDDGWDLYTKTATGPIGPVIIKDSVAFNSGMTTDGHYTKDSDGNGFKLGGEKIGVNHYLENCVAFNNKAHGFTDNSNPGTISLKNCTSFNNSSDANNKKSNFDFARQTDSFNKFENLLSVVITSGNKPTKDKFRGEATNSLFYWDTSTSYKFTTTATADHNVTTLRGTKNVSPVASDFYSIEVPDMHADLHTILRDNDGSVNLGNFLKVKESSSFYGIGANLSK